MHTHTHTPTHNMRRRQAKDRLSWQNKWPTIDSINLSCCCCLRLYVVSFTLSLSSSSIRISTSDRVESVQLEKLGYDDDEQTNERDCHSFGRSICALCLHDRWTRARPKKTKCRERIARARVVHLFVLLTCDWN